MGEIGHFYFAPTNQLRIRYIMLRCGCAGSGRVQYTRARSLGALAQFFLTVSSSALLGFSWLLSPLPVHAQELSHHAGSVSTAPDASAATVLGRENRDALPGLLSLSLPHSAFAPVALGISSGVGLFPAVGTMAAASTQFSGALALGVSPLSFLSARVKLRGDWNLHSGGDFSLWGEPSVAARAHFPLTQELRVGAEIEARLIGAEAPSIDWSATTPTLRALASYSLGQDWLAAVQLGFRHDRSAAALGDVSRLDDAERTVLSAGSYDSLEFGFGGIHRHDDWEFALELGAELLLGSGAPGVSQSPLWLAGGARYELMPQVTLFGQAEFSPSGRPDPYPTEVLIPTRARLSGQFGLIWRPSQSADRAVEGSPVRDGSSLAGAESTSLEPEEKSLAEEQEGSPKAALSGRIVDEGGRPLADVEVTLVAADATPRRTYSDSNGKYHFEDLPYGFATLSASTVGFDAVELTLTLDESAAEGLELSMYQAVPAGQVRGHVRDYQGNPVSARILITPGSHEVELSADGSFSVDLEPGRYSLRFLADGYAPQMRTILIRDKGVVVLDIALER